MDDPEPKGEVTLKLEGDPPSSPSSSTPTSNPPSSSTPSTSTTIKQETTTTATTTTSSSSPNISLPAESANGRASGEEVDSPTNGQEQDQDGEEGGSEGDEDDEMLGEPDANSLSPRLKDGSGNKRQLMIRRTPRKRLIWTQELHTMFIDIVNRLGNKAVPTTILQEMNVEGLTRENIASHLQKYRLQLKKLQKLRDGPTTGHSSSSSSSSHLMDHGSDTAAAMLSQLPLKGTLRAVSIEDLEHAPSSSSTSSTVLSHHPAANTLLGMSMGISGMVPGMGIPGMMVTTGTNPGTANSAEGDDSSSSSQPQTLDPNQLGTALYHYPCIIAPQGQGGQPSYMLPPGVPYQFRAVPGVPGALEPFYYFPYDQSGAAGGQYFPKMNIVSGTTFILPPGTAPSGAQQLHMTQLPVQAAQVVQVPSSSSPSSTPPSSSDPAASSTSQEGSTSTSESKQPV